MGMASFTVSPELAALGGRVVSKQQWAICQRYIQSGQATTGDEAYRWMLIETGKLLPDGSIPGPSSPLPGGDAA